MLLRKLLTVVFASGTLVLAACNTVHGAAEDVGSVGDCVDGAENNC